MIGLIVLLVYFAVLCLIGWVTGKKNSNDDFFRAGRKSPWFVVAFGMVGVSLSGVTFLSVPGLVMASGFSYFEFVLGNILGYWVMAIVLLPLYYKLNLTSIYTYLQKRFGQCSYRSGAYCFILSRIVGASLRLFLTAKVLHYFVFAPLGLPFMATTLICILLIWTYTFKGGIKTVVWTDTLQTFFLLFALVYFLCTLPSAIGLSFSDTLSEASALGATKFLSSWGAFAQSLFLGMMFSIVMNGLDQDMMQKNLTCPDEKSAKKNIFVFSVLFGVAVFAFLILGCLLTVYAEKHGLSFENKDDLFKGVVESLSNNPAFVIFILGVVAAAYSSADSALTALTTSYCVDIANIENKAEADQVSYRRRTHIVFSLILFFCVTAFHQIHNDSVAWTLFFALAYTYGPLLGLFSFGLIMKRRLEDKAVPYVVVFSPVISYLINLALLQCDIKIGLWILILNGMITFIFCFICSENESADELATNNQMGDTTVK